MIHKDKTNKQLLLLYCLCLYSFVVQVQAAIYPLDLGIAGQFNGFVLGDMNAENSDVEGRLAVGGDLTLKDYSVAMQLNDSWNFKDTLVAGGGINYSNGRIYHGNVRSGGVARIDQSVGFYDTDPNSANGRYIPGNILDFNTIASELKAKSSFWGSLTVSGSASIDAYGALELRGTRADLNIFTITAEYLRNTTSFWLDVPENAWALINVTGSSVDLRRFGFYRTINGQKQQVADNQPGVFRYDGNLSQRVLLNLVGVTQLEMYEIGVKASILAPWADTTFYNGQVNGNLIVASLQGKNGQNSGQINNYPFISIVEPPIILLFLSIFPFCLYFQKKSRNILVAVQ